MTHPFHAKGLDELLVARGHLSREQLAMLPSGTAREMAQALLREQLVAPERLAEALAEHAGLPYVDLEGFTVPAELFAMLPAQHAHRLGILPYQWSGDTLHVVVADPFDIDLLERVESVAKRRISLNVSSAQGIAAAFKRSQGGYEVLRGVSRDFELTMVLENEQGDARYVSLEEFGEDAGAVTKLVNSLLLAAIQRRASDLHIENSGAGIVVKNRIDGVLSPATEVLDRRHHAALISRLKVMAALDIAEKRAPQDGRFKLRYGGRDIDFRLSILPGIHGEDAVVRILDKAAAMGGDRELGLDNLGFPSGIVAGLRRAVQAPHGMVLVTGPTGSGKSTTLYAALSEINSGEEKIITIEDPVEYQLPGVVQIPVNERKNVTFATGLRSILRHDPDKIMVGEIRDTDTVAIAIQSALTGHLVFSTVHANSAVEAVERFKHMSVDGFSFATAVSCILAQRLIRLLCTHCKAPAEVGDEELRGAGIDPEQSREASWFRAVGCSRCNGTGYHGRTAIAEFLPLSDPIRQLITAGAPTARLLAAAKAAGMVTLRRSAMGLVLDGRTTIKEMNRVTLVE